MRFRGNEPDENERILLKPIETYEYTNKNVVDFTSSRSCHLCMWSGSPLDFPIQTLNRGTKISDTKMGKKKIIKN